MPVEIVMIPSRIYTGNRSGWIDYFSGQDLNTSTSGEVPMYQGGYNLNFIFGPKFTWNQSGPWSKKEFWLGPSPMQTIYNGSMKSSGATKLNTPTTTTTTTKKSSVLKSLKVKP